MSTEMTANTNNFMNVSDDNPFDIISPSKAEPSYSSIKAETQEEKAVLYNAVSAPDYRLRDFINKRISVKDMYIELINVENSETGVVSKAPRIVLIDTAGKSYQCVSTGILNALKRITVIFGYPTWENGINIEVKQISAKEKQILTLAIAV